MHEKVEKDGSQVSPTSVMGRSFVGEEVEESRNCLVPRPVLAWGMDETTYCHKCSDLEVKLIQLRKEIEHVQQELKRVQQKQESTQHLLQSNEHKSSQTLPTEADRELEQQRRSQEAEEMEQLRHYISKDDECWKKLQEKSEELSLCRKELDKVNKDLLKAVQQKYRLGVTAQAWEVITIMKAGCPRQE